MKQIAGYVTEYFRRLSLTYLIIISLALGTLIWVNYHYELNDLMLLHHPLGGRFWRVYSLFLLTFLITWLLGFLLNREGPPTSAAFWTLVVLSPAVFAVKVSLNANDLSFINSNYLKTVLQWPLKATVTIVFSFVLWSGVTSSRPVAGLRIRGFNTRPYFILLLMMLPLLIAASLGHDFQQVYPKLQMIRGPMSGWQKLFFELCYGLDFFTIEFFFRGFLVLVFARYGTRAILPMAAFYCTIHFGKPVFECVSSYFGGLILGAVVHNTRSIWGGLIIHLGIAWMMEVLGLFSL